MKFREKVVIVTGSSGGIGAACVQKFSSLGATVYGLDVREPDPATFPDDANPFTHIAVNLANPEEVSQAIARIAGEAGQINILVNNAGIMALGAATDLSVDEWNKVVGVNLNGYFYTAKNALPWLVTSQGCIVNIGSISGLVANRRYTAYNATKAAVHNLTRSLAMDYGPQGVRVNAVAPGSIDTPMLRSQCPADPVEAEAYWEALASDVPLKRIGRPSDVANVVAFLASDDAAFVHGAIYPVDGGYTIQ